MERNVQIAFKEAAGGKDYQQESRVMKKIYAPQEEKTVQKHRQALNCKTKSVRCMLLAEGKEKGLG